MFNFTLWPFYHRERTPLPDEKEAGWTPEPVRTFLIGEMSLAFAGIRTPVSSSPHQPSQYTDYATPAANSKLMFLSTGTHISRLLYHLSRHNRDVWPTSTSMERDCPPDHPRLTLWIRASPTFLLQARTASWYGIVNHVFWLPPRLTFSVSYWEK